MNSPYIIFRAALRFLMFLGIIVFYLIHASLLYISVADSKKRRQKLIQNCSFYCRLILKAFNVQLICPNPIAADEQSLLVGNHMGFIDIICLQSIQPAVFITSMEMKQTPVLGQLCDLGGCAYVDRRSRKKIHNELKDIIEVLKSGFRVVLYAEATSSNGEQVLPFKKTLMMSAGHAEVPLRPFVFNYRQVNGGSVEFKYRDHLCWYGDHSFTSAIWKSLQLDSIVCEIEFLPQVRFSADADRSEIAKSVHDQVSSKFSPFTNPVAQPVLSTILTSTISDSL